ncbi:ArsR/SmtB family transcription factor [Tessaracoccus sp.]
MLRKATTSAFAANAAGSDARLWRVMSAPELATWFRSAGDVDQFLVELCPADAGVACHQLGITQPTLSHHLKKLVDAGLVQREYRGRWAHYSPAPAAVDALCGFLVDVAAVRPS